VCHVTTTPLPGVKPRQVNRRVVDTVSEVTAEREVVMADVEVGCENAARVEEEKDCPEVTRESGIARAATASEKRPQPTEDWLERKIGGRMFKLGKSLGGEIQDQIAKVIERHLDAFAWSASDMSGIDPDFLCHCLAMDSRVKPVRQRRRKFNKEKRH